MAMFVMLAISVTMAAISTNLAKRSTSLKHPPELLRKVGDLKSLMYIGIWETEMNEITLLCRGIDNYRPAGPRP